MFLCTYVVLLLSIAIVKNRVRLRCSAIIAGTDLRNEIKKMLTKQLSRFAKIL